MFGMAATKSDSCTSAGRDWVTFAHGERKLFIYVEVRSPSSSTSAMEVIHTDMKPCVLSNVASLTDNCTETLVEQPTEHDATSHPLRGRASVYPPLNQAAHLTSSSRKSKFLYSSRDIPDRSQPINSAVRLSPVVAPVRTNLCSDNDNDHSFRQFSSLKALTCFDHLAATITQNAKLAAFRFGSWWCGAGNDPCTSPL